MQLWKDTEVHKYTEDTSSDWPARDGRPLGPIGQRLLQRKHFVKKQVLLIGVLPAHHCTLEASPFFCVFNNIPYNV